MPPPPPHNDTKTRPRTLPNREFRSLVIDMVLATDMSSHFQQIKAMKNILNHSDNFNADKSKILSLVIHISDISHPAKEWELHNQWTNLLMEEFFRQGDREKELDLECSPLCDRETTLVAESQLGFIEFIVSPSLEICGDVLDRVHYQMAEANTRPVLPASAKAASVVVKAVGAGAHQHGAIAAGPANQPAGGGDSLGARLTTDKRNAAADMMTAAISERLEQSSINEQPGAGQSSSSQSPLHAEGGGGQQQSAATHQRQVAAQGARVQQQQQQRKISVSSAASLGSSSGQSVASSASSFASSFVSSETIASNLRKMIASSSASISRKLTNISTGGIGGGAGPSSSPVPSPGPNHNSSSSSSSVDHQRPRPLQRQTITISTSTQSASTKPGERPESVAEFEARQAQYRHPVIQCEQSAMARPKSSMGTRQAQESDVNNAPGGNQQQQEEAGTSAGGGGASQLVLKRSSAGPALVASSLTSRSAPPLQYFKIQRPWINCLERNKKMWREQAVAESNKPQNVTTTTAAAAITTTTATTTTT